MGNGTINVSGRNGGAGGDSYSYTNGGIICSAGCMADTVCNNQCSNDKLLQAQTFPPKSVMGAGGGGAGGSGGTIIMKTPSNPTNIVFLYQKGMGGAAGKSNVKSDVKTYNVVLGVAVPSSSVTNSVEPKTSGNAGANGSDGVYKFIQTTNF